MKEIIINGGKTLSGNIYIGGAKNSVVALIPAALLSNDVCNINKVPNISDKDALIDILKVLSVDASFKETSIIIDSTNLQNIGLTGYKSTLSAINLTRLIDFYPP